MDSKAFSCWCEKDSVEKCCLVLQLYREPGRNGFYERIDRSGYIYTGFSFVGEETFNHKKLFLAANEFT